MQMKFNRQDNQTKNYLGSLMIILRNLYSDKKATADSLFYLTCKIRKYFCQRQNISALTKKEMV